MPRFIQPNMFSFCSNVIRHLWTFFMIPSSQNSASFSVNELAKRFYRLPYNWSSSHYENFARIKQVLIRRFKVRWLRWTISFFSLYFLPHIFLNNSFFITRNHSFKKWVTFIDFEKRILSIIFLAPKHRIQLLLNASQR